MEEQEILDMQLKDKISRRMVRQQCHARYPERGESYARKVTEARTGREVVTGEGRGGDRSDRLTEEVDQEQMEDQAATTKRVREEECEGGSSGTDEDNQTSVNNRTVREKAGKFFNEVNRKADRSRSRNRSRSASQKCDNSQPVNRTRKSKKNKAKQYS